MSVYLDANVIVAAFTRDALSPRVAPFLRSTLSNVLISDFAAAEFVSAVSRLVRTKELTRVSAQTVFANFDGWTASETSRIETHPSDIRVADAFLRRLDLTLRAPDAINLAIAQRAGAAVATFDKRMADCATKLGISLVKI